MNKEVIFELHSLYRDNFRITGYKFGKGNKEKGKAVFSWNETAAWYRYGNDAQPGVHYP